MLSKKYLIINLLSISFLFSIALFCQTVELRDPEIGEPFIKYYSPKEYHASYQNWCVNEDKRGIMYFGNYNGILEYDGSAWRLIRIPNNSIVRSLCIDTAGRIYVAASSDFGYLSPDSVGQMQFVSLLKYLDKKYREFGDVWDVVSNSKGVYFKTQNKIFRWNGSRIKIYDSVNAYRLYKVKDDVFVRNEGEGLLKISGDSLTLIPNGEKFASIGVYDMLPFGNNILVTTNTDGLFLYDGYKFTKFKTEADSYLIKNRLYNTCELQNGNIAVATMRGGVVIVDKNGHLIRIINSEDGLQSDVIYDVFPDRQGGLWLAMTEGIARVEISSPFMVISKKNSGNNFPSSLYRFKQKIYAANSYGFFYLNESSSAFKPVTGINSGGANLISIGNSLFAASTNMVCEINKDNSSRKLFDFAAPALLKSKIDTNIVYVAFRIGLAILKYNNGSLQLLKSLPIISDEIEYLVEDNDGSLWIKTFYEGVVHLTSNSGNFFPVNKNSYIKTVRYNKKNGLPGNQCTILSVSDKILFATDVGLFKFDPGTKSFLPDSILGQSFNDSTYSVLFCDENKNGDLWIAVNSKNGREVGRASKQKNGKYLWQPYPVFRRLDLNNVFFVYSDYDPVLKKEFLWISSDEGLIRFDPGKKYKYDKPFPTLIRKVIVRNDSLIYNGTGSRIIKDKNTFSFKDNEILFRSSALSYDRPNSNLFQYYLEGYDNQWSQWTSDPVKGYTNLSSGDYKFHVRSKNVYGIIGMEDSFDFTILSPWYFSGWAYLLYIFVFLGFLLFIRDFELKRLNKKHALELDLVAFEKLKELDQLKSQFFANISHEFRTPLTLILGQIESVLSSKIDIKEKGKLHIADRNARRLLTLINQLLDLSKLESGSMELKAKPHNIVSFLKSLFYSFESIAESKEISLKFESEFASIPVLFDPDKMEKIFYNLVSNAFKFTPVGGEIKVSLNILNDSLVEVHVKDTGKGISKEELTHIFDRFYQADGSSTREYEGTGIGLSLTKELIQLHKGNISVTSEEGKGTQFIINLPLGDRSLEKEKLACISADKFSFNKINIDLEKIASDPALSIQQPGSGIRHPESGIRNLGSDNKEIVLIVEDNPDVRAYMREQTENDYVVIEASNGMEGFEKAKEYIPDIIITDVMMPKMDGYKFSLEIRKDEKTCHIPIIMLTAKAGLDDKIEGLETGIDAYLTKPFSAIELKVRVKNLIIQRKELRKKFGHATVIKPSEVSAVSVDREFLQKVIRIIESNFENEKFSVEKLADCIGMSLSQLNRKLNALVDQPAGHLIRSLRLQRAADLLKQNSGSVAEICYQVGFNDQAYFSRSFKKQFGYSPTEFKKI